VPPLSIVEGFDVRADHGSSIGEIVEDEAVHDARVCFHGPEEALCDGVVVAVTYAAVGGKLSFARGASRSGLFFDRLWS